MSMHYATSFHRFAYPTKTAISNILSPGLELWIPRRSGKLALEPPGEISTPTCPCSTSFLRPVSARRQLSSRGPSGILRFIGEMSLAGYGGIFTFTLISQPPDDSFPVSPSPSPFHRTPTLVHSFTINFKPSLQP
ncbi:hypothetical protein FA13DRAFT_498892 [Coprinellus micaceus]|uniref:Uncharacterized protein n=1 Tax=Coprinellus micaceus TaxID=71717 RepID=A0A4Y7TA32_COPMI|nr:hypothetical protein FA13DRAFT_498892 [Coprinellus micaceus]